MSFTPSQKKKSGTRHAVLTVLSMAGAMVLSKGLGMLRSVCMASAYGTGWEAAAFSAASRIPLSFFDLLFSASILGCFIPVYNSFRSDASGQPGKAGEEADAFACIFLNFILLLTGLLSVLGIAFAKPILAVVAPGLPEETAALAVKLLRIMFPMVIFTGSAYTLVGVLQSKEHFLLPSLISAFSNAGVILYFIFLNGRLGSRGIYGLAIAYLASWALQLITLLWPLFRMHFPYRLLLDFKNPALRRALRMTPPIMLGSWLAPIGMLAGTHFAAQLPISGAVTVFEYAINIETILTGILTYGICNFTFPRLSRMNVDGNEEMFSSTARTGVLSALSVVLPVMAAVLVLAEEGTSVLYQHGAFTGTDVRETALALRCLAVGMPAFCLSEVINRILYAKCSVVIPMISALLGAACNILSSFFLVRNASDTLHVGCAALGNTIGQVVCAVVLSAALIRRVPGLFTRAFLASLGKLLFLTAVSAAAMAGTAFLLRNNPTEAGLFHNLAVCALVFLPSGLIYALGLRLLRVRFTFSPS